MRPKTSPSPRAISASIAPRLIASIAYRRKVVMALGGSPAGREPEQVVLLEVDRRANLVRRSRGDHDPPAQRVHRIGKLERLGDELLSQQDRHPLLAELGDR